MFGLIGTGTNAVESTQPLGSSTLVWDRGEHQQTHAECLRCDNMESEWSIESSPWNIMVKLHAIFYVDIGKEEEKETLNPKTQTINPKA